MVKIIAKPISEETDEQNKPLIGIYQNNKERNRFTINEFLKQEKYEEIDEEIFEWEPIELYDNYGVVKDKTWDLIMYVKIEKESVTQGQKTVNEVIVSKKGIYDVYLNEEKIWKIKHKGRITFKLTI